MENTTQKEMKNQQNTACSEASRQKYYPCVYLLVILELAGSYYLSITCRISTSFFFTCKYHEDLEFCVSIFFYCIVFNLKRK